jgi:hypothetical protein
MATVTKLTPTGIHYSGELDEVTFNVNSGFKNNLFQTSQNITSGWYVAQDTLFKENVATAPDGTFTADAIIGIAGITGRKSIYQSINLIAGQTYTYSVYLKSAGFTNAAIWFDSVNVLPSPYRGAGALINLIDGTKSGGTPNETTVTSVGNGWYRCVVTATPTVTGGFNFQVSCGDPNGSGTARGDAISGLYVWGFQLELGSQATIYEATGTNAIPLSGPAKRVDANGKIYISGSFDEVVYNPNSSITTNLVINSQTFTGADWSKVNASISSATELAPDGSSTASFYKESYSTTFDAHQFYKGINPLTIDTVYVLSCYYKPTANRYIISPGLGNAAFGGSDITAAFNLKTLTVSSVNPLITNYGITNVGNGWYRCFVTMKATATGFGTIGLFTLLGREDVLNAYSGDGASGIYVWGAQLEVGNGPLATPSIYVPTTSTTVPNVSYVHRHSANGNNYIKGNYDEVTGILPITDNLLMSYDVAFANSSSILYDASGFNNNVTMLNSPPLIENFFRLNGSTQYGNIISAPLNQPYSGKTIFAILRLDPSITLSGATYRGFIGSNTNSRNFNSYIYTDASGHRIHYSTGRLDGAINGSLSNFLSITAGRWFTVAITQDYTGSGNYYCNGASVGTIGPPLFQYLPNTFEFFGAADNSFFGDISHISVYKRGLSANEITTLHDAFKFRFGI